MLGRNILVDSYLYKQAERRRRYSKARREWSEKINQLKAIIKD